MGIMYGTYCARLAQMSVRNATAAQAQTAKAVNPTLLSLVALVTATLAISPTHQSLVVPSATSNARLVTEERLLRVKAVKATLVFQGRLVCATLGTMGHLRRASPVTLPATRVQLV